MSGFMAGNIISGILSDKIGRKTTMLFSNFIILAFGLASIFS